MADITNQQLLDKLKVLDVLKDDVDTLRDDVRVIVREEVSDIRDEQLRQGVLLEDMDDEITKISKMLTGVGETVETIADNMATKNEVDDLELRLGRRMDGVELRLGRRIDGTQIGVSPNL